MRKEKDRVIMYFVEEYSYEWSSIVYFSENKFKAIDVAEDCVRNKTMNLSWFRVLEMESNKKYMEKTYPVEVWNEEGNDD